MISTALVRMSCWTSTCSCLMRVTLGIAKIGEHPHVGVQYELHPQPVVDQQPLQPLVGQEPVPVGVVVALQERLGPEQRVAPGRHHGDRRIRGGQVGEERVEAREAGDRHLVRWKP